ISIGGYDVEFSLIGDFVSVGKQVEADWNTITTQAVVNGVRAETIPELDIIIENVCWLLSFGFGANVSCSRVDLFNLNGNRVRSTLRQPGASGKPFYAPVLLDQMQGEFKHYLESTVAPFRVKRDMH